jgi:hypothetical protein
MTGAIRNSGQGNVAKSQTALRTTSPAEAGDVKVGAFARAPATLPRTRVG